MTKAEGLRICARLCAGHFGMFSHLLLTKEVGQGKSIDSRALWSGSKYFLVLFLALDLGELTSPYHSFSI